METVERNLARYREGDVEALGELVRQYRRPLFGFILKMTEGRDDAEEIFQEVWIRAIRNLSGYRDGHFLSWLFRIARNLVIDRVRKRKPDVSLQEADDDHTSLEERLPSGDADPAGQSADHDTGLRIRRAIDGLPPEQKEVFLMRTEGDLPFKEIARIQGTSINTALARMQYALEKLRKELTNDYRALGRP